MVTKLTVGFDPGQYPGCAVSIALRVKYYLPYADNYY